MAKNDGYVKTGRSWLGKLTDRAGYLPLIGAPIAFFAGGLDTLFESVGWLLKGKPLSAVTSIGSGVSSVAVSMASATTPLWFLNAGSGMVSGQSLSTHARKATEFVTGGVTAPFGLKPTILRSYPAGVVGINGGMERPGQWANYVSQRSGRDPNQQWSEYVRAQEQMGAQMNTQR